MCVRTGYVMYVITSAKANLFCTKLIFLPSLYVATYVYLIAIYRHCLLTPDSDGLLLRVAFRTM